MVYLAAYRQIDRALAFPNDDLAGNQVHLVILQHHIMQG